MKNILLIAALFCMNLGFSQDYATNDSLEMVSDFENFEAPSTNADELKAFDITADMTRGDVFFNAPENIDLINIYNADNQEIFSAKGSIIENNKINLSFLPSGTYFLEVVIGKNMASHRIVKK